MATQKSLKISPATHRRMKLLSAELDFSADELIVEALNAYEVTRTGVVRVGDIQKGAIRGSQQVNKKALLKLFRP